MKIRNDRIQAMMKEDNISLEEFAVGINKTRGTASLIVNGTIVMPKLNTFADICNFFGCSADYLLGRSDNRHYF